MPASGAERRSVSRPASEPGCDVADWAKVSAAALQHSAATTKVAIRLRMERPIGIQIPANPGKTQTAQPRPLLRRVERKRAAKALRRLSCAVGGSCQRFYAKIAAG